MQAGEHLKAINILGSKGWTDKLIELARGLAVGQVTELRACLPHLENHGATEEAKEVLLKLGDTEGLLQLQLSHHRWPDALRLIEEHPHLAPRVYLPYAQWLIEKDRFEEAQAAFKQA